MLRARTVLLMIFSADRALAAGHHAVGSPDQKRGAALSR